MARNKGKSQKRIKDWHQRYAAGQADDGKDARRESLSRRAVKIPAERLEAPQENLENLAKVDGLVMGFYPGGVVVRVNRKQLLCGVAKTYRAPEGKSALAVGDNVTLALTGDEHSDDAAETDKDRADGMILARADRTTVLARPMPRSAKRVDQYDTEPFEKVITANIDILLIVAATRQPPLSHGLIDRFLIIAERGGLVPVLVINKIDLGPPDAKVLADFEKMGVESICCSALTGAGLDDLRRVLRAKRSVLAGPSGVGKTSLINAIIPGTDAVTKTIRTKNQRGRHTTSATTIYDLPSGAMIVDTPGLRELALNLTRAELPWYFPRFAQLAGKCKFNNCTHSHEPGCAVIAAVEDGSISQRRYDSYIRILETLE